MTKRSERLVVSLNGGGPWGFRLQGGAGTGLPLTVSKVRRKSKAHHRLREGDRILCVNGRLTDGLTYDQLMDIADKSSTDLTLEILRDESDKENQAPRQDPVKTVPAKENTSSTKEVVSFTETSKKTCEEKEGLRIKSATLVQESIPFETITSSKLEEKSHTQVVEPFPSFKDIQTKSISDTCTQPPKNDEKTMKLEEKQSTETSFAKTYSESSSKSTMPDITMDTIDLNNLINETQKRLDTFKNNISKNGNEESRIEKKEMITSSTVSETSTISKNESSKTNSETVVHKELENLEMKEEKEIPMKTDSEKKAAPTLPKLKTQPSLDAFKDCLKEMETDPILTLPDIGFTTQSSEISTTDIPFGTITKKKKMFSSSSFYEEPDSIYPTLEEQVEMAKKIAESLADDSNKKSKGANMFYKRVKRSSKWIHEGPEPSDESGPGTPEVQGVEPPTPDPSKVPFRPSKGPPRLKLILDPRHALDLTALRSSGYVISEHNVVSPEVCHDLVKDLQSPVGKGAALFAKRKKKSEEWVVDEEKVKALLREQQEKRFSAPPLSTSPMNQYSNLGRQDVKLVKSPWNAAMESPYGICDAAFGRVHPDHLADTVMRRADYKRAESLSRESSRMEGCISPPVPPPFTPAGTLYDIYHAKPPKGWQGSSAPIDYLPQMSTSPLPPVSNTMPQKTQNGYQWSKKMVFQNFNAVPRLWKGTNVH